MIRFRFAFRLLLASVLPALVYACDGDATPARHAVATRADDACAVCGMYLDGSPGPRAEAWVTGRDRPFVFDSTRDFFAWVLQPENRAGLRELFVQDSSRIDWRKPSHASGSFMDARKAIYVAWQPLPGSMGPTFASFATRPAAEAFVRSHGGAVLHFDDITPKLVAALDYRCPADVAAIAGRPLKCEPAPAPAGTLPASPASR